MEIRYVTQPGCFLYKKAVDRDVESHRKHQLLLGGRLHVDPAQRQKQSVFARSVPRDDGSVKEGWVLESILSDKQQLKAFFVDVGQGDACLIEAEGAIVIIDGGPNSGFHSELKKRLAALQRADKAVGLPARKTLHVDAVFVSHFDKDHYAGLTAVLKDKRFTFGTIFHNGLPRYDARFDMFLDLGTKRQSGGREAVTADLDDLASAKSLIGGGKLRTKKGNLNLFGKFLDAAVKAQQAGRLGGLARLVNRRPDRAPKKLSFGELTFEVLAPVTTTKTGSVRLPTFPNPHGSGKSGSESHTINGNSVVLQLRYGKRKFLFGGDLNQPSQIYLRERFGSLKRFEADVNKACHHGSSDFDLTFVKKVNPLATVFSSGDAGNYDHPLPDAMGAAARYSRGDCPLVFSTELARETSTSRKKTKIHYGHINARSNGDVVVVAQKKEIPSAKKEWYAYPVPYHGPFAAEH